MLVASGCGSPDLGPAPTISDLTLQSPDPSDTTRVRGSVHVADPLGLTALVVNLTIDSPTSSSALPPITVDTTVEGQLDATVTFGFKSKGDFESGTYQIVVTATEAGIPSNSLTSTMLVE
jgi:hypothetical protein